MPAKSQLVLGIMSGTSVDGVDYALCQISTDGVKLRHLWSVGFPRNLRRRLHEAARNQSGSWELSQLHHDLGRFFAKHALKGTARHRLQLVGLHGQTVFHNPSPDEPATLQLGEPAYLAEALRVPVVSNFRAGDIAMGGQGAPLATMFHKLVFGTKGRHVCVNNLGGISNVTSVDWRNGTQPRVFSFDTGPANVLLDLAMRYSSGGRMQCDRGGRWAARGTANEKLLALWLRHPYFAAPPPKSTGREMFGEPLFSAVMKQCKRSRMSREDVLATLTAFTACSIALNYERHLRSCPDSVVLTGGGAANPTLRRLVAHEMKRLNSQVEVRTSAELGWPIQSIEPAAFALLAWLRIQRQPGNLPETTGANAAALLGQITELG